MEIIPIGHLESCYKDKFGTPRQPGLAPSSWAKLTIRRDLHPAQALEGLEGFSHVWLIFEFHQNKNARYHAKVKPPRLEGKTMGVFATRSPHRPNPLGISLVELKKIGEDFIEIAGCDLVDGTPIYDIKPYLPSIESVPNAREGWTQEVPAKKYDVTFNDESEAKLKTWELESGRSDLRQIITETLTLDPRPLVYKLATPAPAQYRTDHVFRLFDHDIHFRYPIAQEELGLEVCVFDITSFIK